MWTIQHPSSGPLWENFTDLGVFGHCTRYAESIGLPVGLCYAVTGVFEQTLVRKGRREKGVQVSRGCWRFCSTARKRNAQMQKTDCLPYSGISPELDITVPKPRLLGTFEPHLRQLPLWHVSQTTLPWNSSITAPRIAGEPDGLGGR